MRTLEVNQSLSQSQLWQLVTNYYVSKGPNAWISQETPNFVTSSCYIAHYYAQIIIHAMQDWQQEFNDHDPNPFYILELSAGLGEFAFHCLRELCLLQEQYGLTDIKFCYLLTDIVEENIGSWRESQAFSKFIANGQVDFANYDFINPKILELTESKIKLDTQVLTKPLIVIANYVFDTVPCDVFYLAERELQQGVITLQVPRNFDVRSPKNLEDIETSINQQDIHSDVYPEPLFNEILEDYRQKLNSGVINFPVAALRYLQFLKSLCVQGKMLLLVADKGYSTLEMMEQIDEFIIDYHHSLSVLVNFHALEQYFKLQQGDSFYQDRFTQLAVAAYSSEMKFSNMPLTQRFLKIYRKEISPQEYCSLLFELSHFTTMNTQSLLAIFRMSKYDPIVFRLLHRPLMQLTNPYKIKFNEKLRIIFQKMRENIFPLRRTEELDYLIGCVYYVMGDYSEALELFLKYTPSPANEYDYYRRLHDCYQQLNNNIEARKMKPLLRAAKYNNAISRIKLKLASCKRSLFRYTRWIWVLSGSLIVLYFLAKYLISLIK